MKCERLTVGLKYFRHYTNVASGLLITLSFDGETCWSSWRQNALRL